MNKKREALVQRRPEEVGLALMSPVGRVLPAETSQWLMNLVEKSAKKSLEDGREIFMVSAREGLFPVLITGVLNKDRGEATGAIWFGKQGNLPQRLDIAWTMLGQQHHLMETMPEMVEGMCDFLEQWFSVGALGSLDMAIPGSWEQALGEVAKMYDQQQAGEVVTVIHSSAERGVLDEARIMGVQEMPGTVNRAVAKAVKIAFGL